MIRIVGKEAAVANVKLFLDFWNFQLGWNDYMTPDRRSSGQQPVKILWKDVPSVLIAELPTILGPGIPYVYKGARIYASVNPAQGGKDEGLKKFLHNVLGQMTGFQVAVRDRRPKKDRCPHCKEEIHGTVEKGVDSLIVSDLFEGAINDAYDVAILLSNDSDFAPAVRTIQERLNKQVIHVGFRYGGNEIRTACWGHVILDGAVCNKLRDPAGLST
jgi:hypothetical protein